MYHEQQQHITKLQSAISAQNPLREYSIYDLAIVEISGSRYFLSPEVF